MTNVTGEAIFLTTDELLLLRLRSQSRLYILIVLDQPLLRSSVCNSRDGRSDEIAKVFATFVLGCGSRASSQKIFDFFSFSPAFSDIFISSIAGKY